MRWLLLLLAAVLMTVEVNGSGRVLVSGGGSALITAVDLYPGGLVVPDPYAAYPTWYVDAVNGNDSGSNHSAGYIYASIDAALLDVFQIGGTGNKRIVVKPTGTYLPGGSLSANRGSYFPSGAPNGSLWVIQGDPSNSTLPIIDAQLGGASNITAISLGATTIVTFGDPLSGASRQPFAVNEIVYFGNITGTTQLNTTAGTVTAIGGSAGAWTITVNINSTGYGAWVSGGQVWWGGPNNTHPMFAIGVQGSFNAPATTVNHIVIRKLEMINSVDDTIYFNNGSSTDISVQYCYFHGNRYPYSNPSSSGGISSTVYNGSSYWYISNCKFSDMGTRPGQPTNTGGQSWSLNCVPIETYGTDHVSITNCWFDNMYAAIRLKLNITATANNWTISNNRFSKNYQSIMQDSQGSNIIGQTNWNINQNLFYGPAHVLGGPFGWGYAGIVSTQSSAVTWNNNTFGEDMAGCFGWEGATSVTVRDNLCLGPSFRVTLDPNAYGAAAATVFAQLDYNVWGTNTSHWDLDFNNGTGFVTYEYTTFTQWQAAYTAPLDHTGAPTSPAPPDLASLPGSHNPDAHGLSIPALSVSWNTEAKNIPNYLTRNYTITAGSPLLTASSSGGSVGYDPANIGPGW